MNLIESLYIGQVIPEAAHDMGAVEKASALPGFPWWAESLYRWCEINDDGPERDAAKAAFDAASDQLAAEYASATTA